MSVSARWGRLVGAAISAIAVVVAGAPAHAQQTIYNLPSNDVLDPGHLYHEIDGSVKPVDPKFTAFVPRVVAGVGGGVEVGVNLPGNVNPGPDTTTLSPIVKWRLLDGGSEGFTVVAGDHLFLPLRNRSYDLGNYGYLQASRTWAGTRLTGGVYHFTRHVVAEDARLGVQLGIERPVGSRLTFTADWMSGRHGGGYVTPGVWVRLHPRATVFLGYSVGNHRVAEGNHFIATAIGITLR